MSEEELKTLIREFKESVAVELESMSRDLADQRRRFDELADEVRARIATAETAIVNEIPGDGGSVRPAHGTHGDRTPATGLTSCCLGLTG